VHRRSERGPDPLRPCKLIADEMKCLHEDWMIHADQVLADERILGLVYEALASRRLKRDCNRQIVAAQRYRDGDLQAH
jgi:hypothetical protein